jgi:ADP-ribosyl-[dinitrogen reductase] hydrolase
VPDLSPLQSRALGCLLGQLSGDALGSQVEFAPPDALRERYPDGLRDMHDGGTWNTIAGQPTDDSEMALGLARMLVAERKYDPASAREVYVAWHRSQPFDCGNTIVKALLGRTDPNSQANGAMMRVSPLGIFGARGSLDQVAAWARADAALTHPNRVCVQANALFTMAIASAIADGGSGPEVYARVVKWAGEMAAPTALRETIAAAASGPPERFVPQAGWVLIAFRNALYHLANTASLEEAVVATVMAGGDTDTNAAICGALLGAVHGRGAVPERWVETLRACRPEAGPRVMQPRPEVYWPVDAEELALALVEGAG